MKHDNVGLIQKSIISVFSCHEVDMEATPTQVLMV